jgi:hypothetical protein
MSVFRKSKKLSPKKNDVLYYTQSTLFLAYFSEFPYMVVVKKGRQMGATLLKV